MSVIHAVIVLWYRGMKVHARGGGFPEKSDTLKRRINPFLVRNKEELAKARIGRCHV